MFSKQLSLIVYSAIIKCLQVKTTLKCCLGQICMVSFFIAHQCCSRNTFLAQMKNCTFVTILNFWKSKQFNQTLRKIDAESQLFRKSELKSPEILNFSKKSESQDQAQQSLCLTAPRINRKGGGIHQWYMTLVDNMFQHKLYNE